MKTWWKKAMAVTAAWAIVAVGAGTVLAARASSQYAADRITVWIAPAFLLGSVVVWIASFRTRGKR